MKKLGIVLGVFVSLFFGSCEKQTLENEEIELQSIDPDEVEDPGDRGN